MARLRSAPSAQQPKTTTTSTRKALQEKTNTAGLSVETPNDLPDFVKDARPTRGWVRKPVQNEDELVMAGGLGQKSDAPPAEALMTTDELAKSAGPALITAKMNRRPPRHTRKPAQREAQSKVFDDVKRRMRATAQREVTSDQIEDERSSSGLARPSSDALPTKPPPARRNAGVREERSEFSISPSPPPPGKLSAVKAKRSSTGRPDTVLKSQSTPAAETSVLALKHFKRRPRQPSMLAMVQQRAAGRPSISHVQQSTVLEPDDPSIFDIEGGGGDEEDFAPEAEGTPVNLRNAKRTSAIAITGKASSSRKTQSELRNGAIARKRKSDKVEDASSLSILKAKRRRSTDADVALRAHESTDRRESTPLRTASNVRVVGSSPASTPATDLAAADERQLSAAAEVVVPSTEEPSEHKTDRRGALHKPVNEQALRNETTADPVSSSPSPEEPVATQSTDITADPVTQVTPPRPKPPGEKAQSKRQRMMTSTLQSLLPKRRQVLQPRHRKSEYDIESSEDGSDAESSEDETSTTRRRRTKATLGKARKSKAKAKAPAASRKSAAPKQGTRKSTAVASARQTKSTTTGPAAPTKATRTYGGHAASDKENDAANSDFEELSDNDESALPDTSLTVPEVAQQSGELAAAKAKFAEVDGWDMEFESVSFEEGRSSSQTWR